jgi:putative ABC transport system substrate-binding protein
VLCHPCLLERPKSADFPPEVQTASFLDELRKLGWIEGENIALEWRGAAGQDERLAGLAAELVALAPDLLVSNGGTPAALALQRASDGLPMVFQQVGDPVGSGLVASIPHPGGRLTGTVNFSPETSAKRLQLLREAVPRAGQVAVVWNFSNPVIEPDWSETQRAAQQLGVTLQVHDARDPAQIEAAFQQITAALEAGQQPPDALLVGGDPLFSANRVRIVPLVEQIGLPALYGLPNFVKIDPAGLMYFGPNYHDLSRRSAHQVDRILRGTRPADLPVETPSTFELVINLSAAHRIGFEVPRSLLDQATEIIQ